METLLSHEKLTVYQYSIRFTAFAVNLIANLPKGNADLIDQFRRAALSIPLNIAEATGKTGCADNARSFAIARGSALECGALLDVCSLLGFLDDDEKKRGKDLLVAIVAMLSKLARKTR